MARRDVYEAVHPLISVLAPRTFDTNPIPGDLWSLRKDTLLWVFPSFPAATSENDTATMLRGEKGTYVVVLSRIALVRPEGSAIRLLVGTSAWWLRISTIHDNAAIEEIVIGKTREKWNVMFQKL